MTGSRSGESAPRWVVPAAIALFGPLSVLVVALEWVVLRAPAAVTSMLGELAVNGLIAAGFVYGGYWLRESDLCPDRYPRIGRWCLGGLLGFLAINLVLIALAPAPTVESNVAWARGTAVFGAGGGLVVGTIEARSIERARRAEYATVRAEYAETQRQWFDYLNGLLRHEILNKANIIEGNAAILAEEIDDPDADERLEVIRHQTEQMTTVIEDVRVLIRSTESPGEFTAVNLSTVLTDAVTDIQRTYGSVAVETSIPSSVYVRGDELLPRIFSNLLSNAVEHNDSPLPRVSITVERTPGTVTVTVADNGPGIPDSRRETLFERSANTSSNHGLGLYLVGRLVDRYGGTIELSETGTDGTVFTVTLPRFRHPDSDDEPDGATHSSIDPAVATPLWHSGTDVHLARPEPRRRSPQGYTVGQLSPGGIAPPFEPYVRPG